MYLFCAKEGFRTFSIKLSIVAVVIAFAIPASVGVTELIETTFEESIHQTYENADIVTEEAEKSNEENSEEQSNSFMGFLKSLGNEVTDLTDNAKNALSIFIDAIAILLITTCVILVLVVIFFLWIIKLIFGVNIKLSGARRFLPGKGMK